MSLNANINFNFILFHFMYDNCFKFFIVHFYLQIVSESFELFDIKYLNVLKKQC